VIQEVTPKIRIHVWGGLGSQLYAWAFLEELNSRFPNRGKILVLHTATFSRRVNELEEFIPEQKIKVIDDFKEGPKNPVFKQVHLHGTKEEGLVRRNFRYFVSFFKKTLKSFLSTTRLLIVVDSNVSLETIKPWTIWIRGTYYKRKLTTQTLKKMKEQAKLVGLEFPTRASDSHEITLHYRLGDLMTIGSKNPIDAKKILDVSSLMASTLRKKVVRIFSDSPEQVSKFNSSEKIEIVTDRKNLSGRETLYELIKAPYFIGTNSKISEWAVIFRLENDVNSYCTIPNYMLEHFEEIYPSISKARNLNVY
jgi:hypothetical protein